MPRGISQALPRHPVGGLRRRGGQRLARPALPQLGGHPGGPELPYEPVNGLDARRTSLSAGPVRRIAEQARQLMQFIQGAAGSGGQPRGRRPLRRRQRRDLQRGGLD